ncbi:MAG: hypothetical protein CMJ64_21030 [Planctomycetaceae bacterium]|nr:hypothetical protein [Planctomycetaceae bacterium]
MAKIRRVIRKVKSPTEASFDEQFWPVMIALFVLGGLLVGTVLAYMRFDDSRWYANAWLWIFKIPILVCCAIWVLRYVESRTLRRGIQLSVVLCIIVHWLILIVSIETNIFSRFWVEFQEIADSRQPREQLVEPLYDEVQLERHEQHQEQDLLRPVETETPDIVMEELQPEETEPEPTTETPPTPTPEPEITVRPNVVERQVPAQTAPRAAETASRLARQTPTVKPRPNKRIATPQPTAQASSQRSTLTSQQTELQQRATENNAQRTPSVPDVATQAQQPTLQRARRTEQTRPDPAMAAVPTMPRRVETPQNVPRTQVVTNAMPSAAEQTQPQEVQPANTTARRQETTSPRVERVAQPTPSPAASVAARATRREQQSTPQPNIAQTPIAIPNQRTRTTSRPDAATVAAAVAPSPAPSSEANPRMQATSSAIARTQAAAASERQPTAAEPTTSPATQAAAQAARRSAEQTPTEVASPNAGSVARQSASRDPTATATAAAAQASTNTSSNQTAEVSAAASSTRRQAVTAPQVALAEGSPSSSRAPAAPTAATSARANRQRAGEATPDVSQSVRSAIASRSTANAPPSVSTAAANATQVNSGSSSSSPAAVAASSSGLARRATSGASSANSQPSPGGPQVSAAARVVSGSRAAASSVPTVNSNAPSSASPARSSQIANVAASPSNVATPSAARGPAGEAAPTPQASQTAMTRSLGGVTGVGQAANLDRALEAADSPSMVASGSARRAEATQSTPQGPALAPSAPALVRHSQASSQRPSSSLQATTVESAAVAGSQEPATTTVSASGTLRRSDSNAESGAVTATAGQVEVDLGPTRVVSGGGASRAAGGGQPDLNLSSQAELIARSNSGGAAQPSIDSTIRAETAEAPAGDGGGQPTPEGISPMLADVGRGEPSSAAPGAGAPSGSTGEPSAAETPSLAIAGGTPSRADGGPSLPEVAASGGASGSEDEEDEEERARRIARQSAGGGPQIAMRVELPAGMSGAVAANDGEPTTASGEPTGGTEAASTALAQAASSGGAPTAEAAAAQMAAEVGGGGEVAGAAIVSRAEAVDGFKGTPEPGSGTASPRRAAPAAQFAASVVAPTVAMAGAPSSAGAPSGSPVDTFGPRVSEATAGRAGTPTASVGAERGDVIVEGVAEAGALAGAASQARSAANSGGPSVGESASSETPVRRASIGRIELGANAAAIGLPAAPSSVALARADTAQPGVGSDLSPMTRQAASAIAVSVDQVEGPAGLGFERAADVGLNTRRAREDSVHIQPQTMRFVRKEVGGPPSVNTAAVLSADAFRKRTARMLGDGAGTPRAGAGQTDEQIELGLAFLARHQLADGSWSLQAVDNRATLVSDTAATGLCLLAFQGFGHTHRDGKYATNVRKALDYLIANQKDNGDLFIPLDDMSNRTVWLYSHGIAAIAMCEAYGMTQDPTLRASAQKAIDFIVESQHKEYGGWRYAPGLEADSSVTGWMMMALKSGELANLEVPTETYARIEKWLDVSVGSRTERHLYRYNPYAPDTNEQRHGRGASTTMTAVGLLMRFYTGWRRDNEEMRRGADFLKQNLPNLNSPPAAAGTNNPNRDTYYWYYASQVMFHMGGEHWEAWNEQLRSVIVETQVKTGPLAGSWHPRLPVPDRWAPFTGRLYVTTMNLLSLEVHYRHLPLYEETAR